MEPLDFVGAGVVVGAGAGGVVGGAIVGADELVPADAGAAAVEPLTLDAGVVAAADGDGAGLGVGPSAVGLLPPVALAAGRGGGVVDVAASVFAADLANIVIRPTSVTRLARPVRQVRRDSRRSPASR